LSLIHAFNDAGPPPERPDSLQQRDALQKGLGRALRWARGGRLTDGEELHEAVLHDRRFDFSVEECRGDWLWRVIHAADAVETFREPLLNALTQLSEESDAHQHCELAYHYARHGDDRFRDLLRWLVAEKPLADSRGLGEAELVRLEGEAGLLFAIRLRGSALEDREWEWGDRVLIDKAIERLGETRVRAALDAAESDSAVQRFREAWQASERPGEASPHGSHRERMRQYSVAEIAAAAESRDGKCFFFRGWGMYADDADLRDILDRILKSDDPQTIANYLRVFSNRACPGFDERLLALLDHEDKDVRRWAYIAVAQNSHPLVRTFAVREITRPDHDEDVIQLFARNFMTGDEELITSHLALPEDAWRRHGVLLDLVKVLERNADADSSHLAVAAYAATPCGTCRFYAAKLLVERGSAPPWLISECRSDAVADIRGLVGEQPWGD
jgi:hypothetical protein